MVYLIEVKIPNGDFLTRMLTSRNCAEIPNPLCLSISNETGSVLVTNPYHRGKGCVVKCKVKGDMLIVKKFLKTRIITENTIGCPVRIINHVLCPEVLHDLIPRLPIIPGNMILNHFQHSIDDAL